MLRFYKIHNLASNLFHFNKETQVQIFFECVFGKSKCDCRCLHFWHDCCFLESSVSLISCVCIFDTIAASLQAVFHRFTLTISLPEERPSYEEPSSPVGRMQSGLAALFVTPSPKKMMDTATNLLMANLSSTRESHRAQRLHRVF